jgi:hypothetical protein
MFATVQVYEDAAKARAAFAGVLEFEASEGHDTTEVGGVGEQAAAAVVAEGEETQVRLHTQEANATVSMNMFVTGAPPEGGDVEQLTKDLTVALVDALPRVGN